MARLAQARWRVVFAAVLLSHFFDPGVANGQILYEQVLSMGVMGSQGINPQTRLLPGGDGALYGTTYNGGPSGRGVIFRINEDGSGFKVLHEFKALANDGANPYADLVFGPDGALYGTTQGGGANGQGVVFTMSRDGSDYRVLFHFAFATGGGPRGHLLQGADGAFYSTTQIGGAGGEGVVYKIQPDGTGYAVLHHFGIGPTGSDCDTGLTLGSDGVLYGVTSSGGTAQRGTVFRINVDGSGFATLHSFLGMASGDGEEPDGRLVELNGVFYGTTERGGIGGVVGNGTIYRINRDGGVYEVVRRMDAANGDPAGLTSELILGGDDALYSTGGSTVFKIMPDGSGLQVLHRFVRGPTDGGFVHGVAFGADGALYGVTQFGGATDQGIVFRATPDGSEYAVLHHFRHGATGPSLPRSRLVSSSGVFFGTGESGGSSNAGAIFSMGTNGTDARVILTFGIGTHAARVPNGVCAGPDGFLYGTTQGGGSNNLGTLFRIRTNGLDYSTLRHLGGTGEPRTVRATPIMGSTGWLYATSRTGGSSSRGTVFKVHKNTGELVILRHMTTGEGYEPYCDLIQMSSGTLYGTTSLGGSANLGTIFRLEADGSGYTNLHHFTGGASGQNPTTGLMLASDGKLYGVTGRQLGTFGGCIYTIAPDGSGFQVLHSFSNSTTNPRSPRGTLAEGPDEALYGSTALGGAYDKGTLFRILKDGNGFQILRHLGEATWAAQTPSAALTPVGDGSFLGVAEAGGDLGTGAVFRLDPVEVRLRIELTASNAELRWPASSTTDVLEAAPSSGPLVWQPGTTEVSRVADENRVSITRLSTGQFFRVQRVW